MSWKQSLDRYLTTPPEDDYCDWAEATIEAITDDFYSLYGDWIDSNELCDVWLQKCYNDGYVPVKSAQIIERAYLIYIKK